MSDDLTYIREQRARGAEGWSGADIDYLLRLMDAWQADYKALAAEVREYVDPEVAEAGWAAIAKAFKNVD